VRYYGREILTGKRELLKYGGATEAFQCAAVNYLMILLLGLSSHGTDNCTVPY